MQKSFIFIIIVFILIPILCNTIFIVQESQKGIVLRFGKVLRNHNNIPIIYKPGLHTKIPFIESIKFLDSRIHTMENQADRFVTMEKKDLIIDSYIQWKINNFSQYYLATGGDVLQAESLLKQKFSDRLRSELGKLTVKEIVTDSRNRLMNDVKNSLNYGTNIKQQNITKNTTINSKNSIFYKNNTSSINNISINNNIYTKNPNSMETLGIYITDVRIKQINLPSEVSDAIYQRMRAEREAVARRHRSQGLEEAEKLRAAADYKVIRILAESEKKSLIMRGEADAEVTKLYANTFNQSPSFYSFIRRLQAYKNSFNKNDFLILNSNNEFLSYFMKNIKIKDKKR